MSKSRRGLAILLPLFGLAALAFLTVDGARADDDKKKENAAIKPVPREGNWVKRHESFLKRAEKGGVDVLFLGDSITQGWEGSGKEVWKKKYEPLKAANFGIGGDQTQHVLWRITEGKELEGIDPKAIVIMIGTNNMGRNTEEEIAAGVTAIVKELRKREPQAKILLLGVFPRSEKADAAVRDKVKKTNKLISGLGDDKSVFYLDIGGKFLSDNGDLSKEVMPDFLHLSPKGYQIWADAIEGKLQSLLK